MVIKKALLLMSAMSLGFAAESMTQLLNTYKAESELSKITKSESAGFVDIYTREDLEKMQAHTLLDVMKLFTIPNVSRTAGNTNFFTKPTMPNMPYTATRIYINDHDMASTSFESAMTMWSDMPVEYIDHIVVYKSSSSVEFGNEPGTVIIKLYTKRAEREEGGKVRVMADQKGSYEGNAYYAHTTADGFSYLFYVNKDDVKGEKYYNEGHELNSDKSGESFYANLFYKNWRFEAGHYGKDKGNLLGKGKSRTPSGGGLEAQHDYLHLTKEFENDFKLQVAYDQLDFDESYVDENGINAGAVGLVTDYDLRYQDQIFSLIGEKTFHTENNKLLIGGFYKRKGSEIQGTFDTTTSDFDNALNLYSLYAEESYSFDETTMFVASLKGDFYRYDKEVKSQDQFIARAGVIKNIDHFQVKAFYTKTYYAIPLAYLYSTDNIPYKTDPDLKYPEPSLTTLGVRYKNNQHELDVRAALISVKNRVAYSPSDGFINTSKKHYQQYEFKYTYRFDQDNRISCDVYTGSNSDGFEVSPEHGGHLVAFNSYGKFDIYNELGYRSSYEIGDVYVGHSYDYTAAVKYHATPDFSVGIRGENIFDRGFEQAYTGATDSIPVFDQKVWMNLEYLF